MNNLANALQAKYGLGKKLHDSEPTEEEFEAAAKKLESRKRGKSSDGKENVGKKSRKKVK